MERTYSGGPLAPGPDLDLLVISKQGEARWVIDSRAKAGVDKVFRAWIPYSRKSRTAWFLLRTGARLGLLRFLPGVSRIQMPGTGYGPWSEGLPELEGCAPIVFIGKPSVTAKLILFMCDGTGNIAAVVKLPLSADAARSIAIEAAALRELHDALPSIPRLIALRASDGTSVQTWVDGKSISRDLSRQHIDLLLKLPRGQSTVFLRAALVEMAEELDPRRRSLALSYLPRLDWLVHSPTVWEHGDFVPWNMKKLSGGSITLLDWEYSRSAGLPLQDLCHFFYRQQFLFNDLGTIHRLVRENEHVTRYCAAFGLTDGCILALTAYYLLRCLRFEVPDAPSGESYEAFLLRQLDSLLLDSA